MQIQLLVAAREPSTGDAFRATVEDMGASCTVVYSLTDMYYELSETPYHGLLLEVPVTVRATDSEKAMIHDLLGRISVLRVAWNASEGQVRSSLYDGKHSLPIPDFIRDYCHEEASYSARRKLRLPLHLQTLIAAEPEDLRKGSERSVTLNVSPDGCFLISSRDWSAHRSLWLEFTNISDPTPVKVDICWRIPWGLSFRMPGMGVRFVEMTDGQKKEIEDLLKRRPWLGGLR